MNSFIFNLFLSVVVIYAVYTSAKPSGVPYPGYGGGFPQVVQSISQLDNECNTKCIGGPNDICKICAWACPDTCDNVDNPPPCHAPCKPNTCDCVEGTVRNLATGQCVLPMSCP
ncbi:hypothetical protein PV327_009532, partial [Microctonus hyperodae]